MLDIHDGDGDDADDDDEKCPSHTTETGPDIDHS